MRTLLIGIYFGVVLTKSEVISWFRIQEMFRFQSFHMYGVIASALAVAAVSLQVLKRRGISLPAKELGKGTRYWLGGTIFGVGWGLAATCPGPIFALLGNGYGVALVLLASAMLGTYAYAWLRPHLQH